MAASAAAASLPVILVPGLNCSARLYAEQIPALWQFGPVTVADHRRDDSMAAMARRILADAPPRFALAGLSMGGYLAFEILRQAADRVARLALLDTGAGAEVPERTTQRKPLIALAQQGGFAEITEDQFPLLVHRSRHGDTALKAAVRAMNEETGPDAYCRQQQAIMGRPDSRPGFAAIACPTLVLVGDDDQLTPPALAHEMANGIRGARLVVVPECGHLSTMERPQAVTQALLDWMRW
ncbi:MAG TPA: alpha/beta fold hydrolase [Xanthobacteraceae bacterium]|nr:alpha/beta fold hydrolase [Xanthobacteraceae bacterium]